MSDLHEDRFFPRTIAIDGPAASGKSTLAEGLAEVLGYLFFDTGVMYRAVTLAALQRGIDVGEEDQVTRIAGEISIDVRPASVGDGRQYDVLLDDVDVTWAIRSAEVEAMVSPVSAYPGVRKAMTLRQREIGLRGRVIMVGRDIGTVVLPEADFKIFLDASLEERAHRRHKECLARGEEMTFEEVLTGLRLRDQIDSTRDVAPLVAAEDAVVFESTKLNVEQVLSKALQIISEANDPPAISSVSGPSKNKE
jgi:cytidylate kinase